METSWVLIDMGNPRGVARDFDALEVRRMKALALMRDGLNNSQIGRELGIVNQTDTALRSSASSSCPKGSRR